MANRGREKKGRKERKKRERGQEREIYAMFACKSGTYFKCIFKNLA